MTVAAMLAVIDSLDGHRSDELRCACAIILPAEERRFRPVEHWERKLDAILREHGAGSLLVIHPNTVVPAEFRKRFDRVWAVSTYSELAAELAKAQLLAPLMKKAPLGRMELQRVRDSLHWLVRQDHNYLRAADLGDRLRACERTAPIDPGLGMEIAKLNAEACRHHGRFSAAVELGQGVLHDVTSLGELTSEDEEADAAAEHAAALFDNHQFDAIPPLLESWSAAAVADPRRFHSLTRVKIWNTLGRALAILGRAGWEALFQRSYDLHCRLNDLDNADRTMTYRVQALLRTGRAVEADKELAARGLKREVSPPSSPWLAHLLAEAARVSGACWPSCDLEAWAAATRPRHALGMFFQAIARQTGRSREDAAKFLGRAALCMKEEAGPVEANICNLFAFILELAAAAYDSNADGWTLSLSAVRRFLDQPDAGSIRAYYFPGVESMPASPDIPAAESLVRRVPYF
jgi:hypothetical protein